MSLSLPFGRSLEERIADYRAERPRIISEYEHRGVDSSLLSFHLERCNPESRLNGLPALGPLQFIERCVNEPRLYVSCGANYRGSYVWRYDMWTRRLTQVMAHACVYSFHGTMLASRAIAPAPAGYVDVYSEQGYQNTGSMLPFHNNATFQLYNPSGDTLLALRTTTKCQDQRARIYFPHTDVTLAAPPNYPSDLSLLDSHRLYAMVERRVEEFRLYVCDLHAAAPSWEKLYWAPTAYGYAKMCAAGPHALYRTVHGKHTTEFQRMDEREPPPYRWQALAPLPNPQHCAPAAMVPPRSNGDDDVLVLLSKPDTAPYRYSPRANRWDSLSAVWDLAVHHTECWRVENACLLE